MKKQTKKKKLKNTLPKKTRLNRRIFFVGTSMCLAFAMFGVEIIVINLFKGEEYARGALSNMNVSEKTIEAPRGLIQDRNERPLATSLLAYDITLSPFEIVNNLEEEARIKVYETLATHIEGQTVEKIKASVEERIQNNPNSKWLPLVQKIELETEVADELAKLGGVDVKETYIRYYPNGELAAQVLGFYNKNEEGQYGVEQEYDDYLTGQEGRIYQQFQQSNIITKELQEPKAGATVTLTLDKMIQQYVSQVMEKYIKQYKPISASAIIMNPNSGEILGMYSYPSFNPNTYNDLSEQLGKNVWVNMKQEQQTKALLSAWKNYSIQYNYEPGSTFKPLLVAMALEENVIKETDTYYCQGHKQVADRTIHCWKTDGHGVQTLGEALANSCNVAMMEIAEKLDNDIFMEYMSRYGFGEKTGIELAGEETGILHTSLGPVQKATSSIGQTFTVTPIQLITAFSSVINGGYLMEPYVVSDITSSTGESLLKHDKVTRRQVISTPITDLVKKDLKKVVDEGGTGTTAYIPGYSIGGKTGTGEKFIEGTTTRDPDNYIISFIGFAPVENPQVVALIVFDNMPERTGVPTKAFKEMMENIFPYLGIPKDASSTEEREDVASVPEVAGRNLYEAIKLLEQKGFQYQISGNGLKVNEQYPEAGEKWGIGDKVILYTKTDQPDTLVEVPNLIDKTMEEATELVEGNFTIEGTGSGKITKQIPEAGTKIEKNNKIIVQISES